MNEYSHLPEDYSEKLENFDSNLKTVAEIAKQHLSGIYNKIIDKGHILKYFGLIQLIINVA